MKLLDCGLSVSVIDELRSAEELQATVLCMESDMRGDDAGLCSTIEQVRVWLACAV